MCAVILQFDTNILWQSNSLLRPRSAYLIIRTIQLVFWARTVFFSHNNSARRAFFSQVSASRTEPKLQSTWSLKNKMAWDLESLMVRTFRRLMFYILRDIWAWGTLVHILGPCLSSKLTTTRSPRRRKGESTSLEAKIQRGYLASYLDDRNKSICCASCITN